MAEDNDSTYSKFLSSISETQGWKPSTEEERGIMGDRERVGREQGGLEGGGREREE